MAIVFTNITARKRAEEALRAEQARLRAILDALPVAVWIAHPSGCISESNQQAKNIWREKDIRGQSIANYAEYKRWWPDTGKQLRAEDWAMARALTKGEVVVGEEVNIRRFDGSTGTILNNSAPIYSAQGEIIGAVTIGHENKWRKTFARPKTSLN